MSREAYDRRFQDVLESLDSDIEFNHFLTSWLGLTVPPEVADAMRNCWHLWSDISPRTPAESVIGAWLAKEVEDYCTQKAEAL